MTEVQKMQNELNSIMAEMKKTKNENTVKNDCPELTRAYKRRKTTTIKASDVCSL